MANLVLVADGKNCNPSCTGKDCDDVGIHSACTYPQTPMCSRRAEALALPGSTFGKKTQARTLSKEDQASMIARSNRASQASALNPPPPPRAAEGVSGWRS